MAASSIRRDDSGSVPVLYDEWAEQGVLGSCLCDPNAMVAAARMLTPDDFYRPFHAFLFRLMLDLYTKHQIVDLVTVYGEMQRREPELARLDTPDMSIEYVASLLSSTITSSYVEHYAMRVLDMADRTRIARAASRAGDVYKADADPDVVIESTAAEMRDARRMRVGGNYRFIGDVADDAMLGPLPRVTIGPPFDGSIDYWTGGFEPGQMVVVAARPSVGKSAIAIQWLATITSATTKPVGFVSLEMSERDVRNRLMAGLSGLNLHTFRSKRLVSFEERQQIEEARDRLATMAFMIDDNADASLSGVLARARAMRDEQCAELIAIDYLQLMHVSGSKENRTQEVGRISGAMKQLARELQIPVVVLAQLNRGVEMRPDAEPKLSDLRDSGAIEQDSDVVILMHRTNQDGIVKLIVAKNRNGPTGFAEMRFVKGTAWFEAIAEGRRSV